MNVEKLKAILASHAEWRRGGPGERASLERASLERASLRGADLGGADLGGADFNGADLGGADLRDANLRGASLGDADLGGAIGVVCLPVGDPTYRPVAVDHGDEWMIASGCRWFTVDEARAHWSADGYARGRILGQQYVAAMDWLEANSDTIRGQWK